MWLSCEIAAPPPHFPLVALNNTVRRLHRHHPQKKRLSALVLRAWSRRRSYIMSAAAEISACDGTFDTFRCFWPQIRSKMPWDCCLVSFLFSALGCKITVTNSTCSIKRTTFWLYLTTFAVVCVDFNLSGKGFQWLCDSWLLPLWVTDDVTSLCSVPQQNIFIIFPFKEWTRWYCVCVGTVLYVPSTFTAPAAINMLFFTSINCCRRLPVCPCRRSHTAPLIIQN